MKAKLSLFIFALGVAASSASHSITMCERICLIDYRACLADGIPSWSCSREKNICMNDCNAA
ncbi:hypothetical protein V8J88_10585 [Massilia sp. W12]|uniref:hypothetical protein n=1 Tax=Massilia sp. W12 TaxID=3126507 RepID=UPI0030CF89DE